MSRPKKKTMSDFQIKTFSLENGICDLLPGKGAQSEYIMGAILVRKKLEADGVKFKRSGRDLEIVS